jgi:hypothetical protein
MQTESPPAAPTTKPPTSADTAALEYAKRLAAIDGKRRTGTSGLLRALAEGHAELDRE